MADLIPPMLIQLQADVSQLKTGLAQAENAIKGVDQSVQTASTGMTSFANKVKQIGASIGIAFAGTQVLQFGRDVIAQAMEAEAQQQRLYQLMKVGTGATDEQIAALNAQAEALEKVGVVTGGNITQTQSQLATFNLQTETIQRLTPAILDYVTAEKGANASADEFKQMTNGLAQALNGNFGSLTRVGFVLDDHTKKLISSGTEAERSAAIVDVLNSTYKGFNEELRNTPAGQMQALKNDFDKLKEELGKKLLPALLAVSGFLTNTFIPALRSLGKFIKDNGDAIKIYAGIIVFATGVFYAYKAAVVITSAVTAVYTAIVKAQAAGHTLATIAAGNFAVAMYVLNAAMRANPIGVIITALTVLGAAFVFAWKKSETFRGIVIKGVQIILTGFGYLVQGIGKFIGMLSKVPGMGWAKGIADGAQKASESIKATSKNLSDLKSNVKSGYGEGAFTYGSGAGTSDKGGGGSGGGKGLTDKEKKKLQDYKKDVEKIYKDMNEVIKEAQEKAAEAEATRNERILAANEAYLERKLELEKNYAESIAEAEKRYGEAVAEATKRRQEAELEATKRYNEKVADIQKDYNEKRTSLEENYTSKVADIRQRAADKSADLIRNAAEKQQSIVQQSMDRLRNAFASGTGFDLGEAFKSGATSADKMLDELKKKLQGAKDLQANAAKLAGMGYSQTFIEQVVKQGPEAGNKIAEALKNASPEATAEMQRLYGDVENISNNGLDSLAKTMNAGGKLATQELMEAYNQVSTDLAESLKAVNEEMNKSLAETLVEYNKSVAEAEKTRQEAMAEAKKNLDEAMAEAKKRYDEAMAEALKNLTEAREKAQKALSEGLAEAQKTLQKALVDAQKDFEKAVDAINKSTQKKLDDLKSKIAEIAAAMKELSAAAAALALAKIPTTQPIIPSTLPGSSGSGGGGGGNAAVMATSQTNININGYNLTDPAQTGTEIANQIKYGSFVRIAGNPGTVYAE